MQKQRRDFLEGLVIGVGGLTASSLEAEPARENPAVNSRLFSFVGGNAGAWRVIEVKAVLGEPLPAAAKLDVVNGPVPSYSESAKWILRGVTSNERYVTRQEKASLVAKQVSLGRPEATSSAVIPIRKNAEWWKMSQEERRAILEEQSHHIRTGLKYLPAIARRLHHCRDLGESQPFDFITQFDYAKADSAAFEELVGLLRASEEWKFVDREVDIRLMRDHV